MVRADFYNRAMYGLHLILVEGRLMASRQENTGLFRILDALEILPKYLVEPEDRTDVFRLTVEELAREFNWPYIISAMDDENPNW